MPHDGARIGLLEDDLIMGESLVRSLGLEGHDVQWWSRGEEAMRALERDGDRLDLVICDIRLPDMSGEDVFRGTVGKISTPFLFMSAYGEIDQAVRLMKHGAVDFITKPFEMESLLERISETARQRWDDETDDLGPSESMRRVASIIRRYADHDLPVLIRGETGTGKEVCARYLHRVSKRRTAPFVAVNCAAIPNELLESELFGHEKGAFTSAHQLHRGYAERAGEGVLFLDEIGDMPPRLQSKLLRLVEDGMFYRLGGEIPIPFKARVVSATRVDIENPASGFREDLFYRLSALPLELPPLRERPDDISWLAERFFEAIVSGRSTVARGISRSAEDALVDHDWPGNVRELRNRLERAAVLSTNLTLLPSDLFLERGHGIETERKASLSAARDAAERREIVSALEKTGGHIAQAARLLSVSRTTLWEKMTRLGVEAQKRSETRTRTP